jgi:hypothetical protein
MDEVKVNLEVLKAGVGSVIMSEQSYLSTMETIRFVRGNDLQNVLIEGTKNIMQYVIQQGLPHKPTARSEKKAEDFIAMIKALKECGEKPSDYAGVLKEIFWG